MSPVKVIPSKVSRNVPLTASTVSTWTSLINSIGSPFVLVAMVITPRVPPSTRVSRMVSPGMISSRSIVSENEPSTPSGTAWTVPMEGLKFVSPGRNTGSRSRSALRSSLMPPVMTSGPSMLLAWSNIVGNDLESSPSTSGSGLAVTVTVCGSNQSLTASMTSSNCSIAMIAPSTCTSGRNARIPSRPAPRCVRVGSAVTFTVTVSPAFGALESTTWNVSSAALSPSSSLSGTTPPLKKLPVSTTSVEPALSKTIASGTSLSAMSTTMELTTST